MAPVMVASAAALLAAASCSTRAAHQVDPGQSQNIRAEKAPRASEHTTTAADWRTLTFGLCEDYPEEPRSMVQARRDLAIARESGAKVLRIAFGWDAMEPRRGVYDWTFWDEFVELAVNDFGMRLIPYVCYTPEWAAREKGPDFWRTPPADPNDFARFVHALVTRYRGRIDTWELWNEPDNRAYWLGSAEDFAALTRAGSRAVRAAAPEATVVLGGIATETSFLEELFAIHRIAPHIDVVNLHSYFETWHPDPVETLPEFVTRVAEIVRDHGESEALWMAELGYSSVGPRAQISEVNRIRFSGEHTDEAQAGALVRSAALAMAHGALDVFAWYRINDLPPVQDVIGDDNNRHLGIRRVDGTPKPVERAFEIFAEFASLQFRAAATSIRSVIPHREAVQVHVFERPDGAMLLAAWIPMLRSPTGEAARIAEPDLRTAQIKMSFPHLESYTLGDVHAFGSADHETSGIRAERGSLTLTVSGRAVLLAELHAAVSR